MKESKKPTEKELEILQVLWTLGPSTVRTVNEKLSVDSNIGYTTTLKFMQIMHKKGLVTRIREGKMHLYSANISEQKIQKSMVDQLLDNAFKGSAMKLVMQALGNRNSSKLELDEIRKYLDQLERGQDD